MTDSLHEVLTENQNLYQRVQALTAENKRLREALKFYADGKHIMQESEFRKGNVCPPIGHYAKLALEKVK
jgi:hypothetical protein